MLNPSVIDLLVGVADALHADVTPELGPGPARDQLQAAVAILRRVARALPQLPAYLLEDIAELTETLRNLGAPLPPLPDAVIGQGALPATMVSLDVLIAHDLALRAGLAELIETEPSPATAPDPEEAAARQERLRLVLVGLNQREAGLRLSPWGR